MCLCVVYKLSSTNWIDHKTQSSLPPLLNNFLLHTVLNKNIFIRIFKSLVILDSRGRYSKVFRHSFTTAVVPVRQKLDWSEAVSYYRLTTPVTGLTNKSVIKNLSSSQEIRRHWMLKDGKAKKSEKTFHGPKTYCSTGECKIPLTSRS